jgi:cell division protease FtsH
VETQPATVEEVVFGPTSQSIEATVSGETWKVHYPSDQSQIEFQNLLQGQGVEFDSKGTGGSSWGFLIYLLPFVLFLGLWIFLMRSMQGGGGKLMSFGKSRAKRISPDAPKVTFGDIAGADEAVEELQEIKEFLENPKKFQALGARIPKGVLLYGPPGTGKDAARARGRR